jgi:ATP-dependent Clp protease, protease subunit
MIGELKINCERSLLLGRTISESNINEMIEKIFYLNQKDGSILLQINSAGGCVSSAKKLYEHILLSRNEVIGLVTGDCFSAAVTILQACNKRYATPLSVFGVHYLAHNISFSIVPNKTFDQYMEYVNSEFDQIHFNNNTIRNILKRKMTIDEKQLHDLLNNEKVLNAEEALKFGLIDKIIDL